MTDTAAPALKTTPLHARHRAAGARMVAYAGWDMPVEYSGITAEHLAVRTRAGVFDVSHMGQIEIAGKDALATVQHLSCNDASRLKVGRAHYSGLLTPDGTYVDDILVYRMAASHFMLVVNAANTAKAYTWIVEQAKAVGEAAVVDSSARYALLAVQGPAALDTVQPLTGADLASLRPYGFTFGEVAQARALISRTGYTGEDGFEIYVPPNVADRVWQALLQAGTAAGVVPCGLGARDTLRLEAAMRLYGQDIDDTTTPLEAGLEAFVGWDKPSFIGAERLRAQRAGRRRAHARRSRDHGSRDRPSRLLRAQGRHRGGDGHERHADAVPQEGRRHGLSAAGAGGPGHQRRSGHPRARLRGRRRRVAVLQARAPGLTPCPIRAI